MIQQAQDCDPAQINLLFTNFVLQPDKNMSGENKIEPFEDDLIEKKSQLSIDLQKRYRDAGDSLIR